MQDGNQVIKPLISRVYESNQFNQALDESLHPGGLDLTARAAQIAGIKEHSVVLDIASGRGTTARFLSQEYGCKVTGIDLSSLSAWLAHAKSSVQELNCYTSFMAADAESLPFAGSSFDFVISECSFSLLPRKSLAAMEIARVLKPGGKLIITDVILKHPLSKELRDELTFECCFSGAETEDGYVRIFEEAGLGSLCIEDHSTALKKVTYQVITGYGSLASFWEQFGTRTGPCCSSEKNTGDSRRLWMRMFREGKPGYGLMAFNKFPR